MATYNGERYLEEQLESLRKQTFPPKELIVGDDGSTDNTTRILEAFAREASFPVAVIRHPERLGYAENFLRTAAQCTGEWVAFCDQDDVWFPEKLESCADAIGVYFGVNLILQNAELCDSELKKRGRVFPNIVKPGFYGANEQHGFWVWPGFVQTIRAELIRKLVWEKRPRSFNRTNSIQSHDQWTCMISNAIGGICVLETPAALHRRHESSLSGAYAEAGFREQVTQAKSIGKDHYSYLSAVARESADNLRGLAGLSTTAIWSQRLLEGAGAFECLSRAKSLRSALYSEAKIAERMRCYFELWRAGAYLGRRFIAMGWRSAVKDGLITLFGGQNLVRTKI